MQWHHDTIKIIEDGRTEINEYGFMEYSYKLGYKKG
jgi:hypothetical protein